MAGGGFCVKSPLPKIDWDIIFGYILSTMRPRLEKNMKCSFSNLGRIADAVKALLSLWLTVFYARAASRMKAA